MFKLTIETDSDAFAADPNEEIARILRAAATKVESGSPGDKLLDANRKTVGKFSMASPLERW